MKDKYGNVLWLTWRLEASLGDPGTDCADVYYQHRLEGRRYGKKEVTLSE